MMLTPAQVAEHLSSLSRELDAAVENMIECDERATRAKGAYEVAFARATLKAHETEGFTTVAQREAQAKVDTEAERTEQDVSAALLRAAKAKVDVLRVRIDVGRTLSATTRSEMSALGGQP